MKDYRLSFFINQICNLKLKKIDDFIQKEVQNELCAYSLFFYNCVETNNSFSLISNHHPEKKLIPALKQFDYFLLIQNQFPTSKQKEFISKLKKIPNILTVYEIDYNKFKNVHNLLIDIELQLINYLKQQSVKKIQS